MNAPTPESVQPRRELAHRVNGGIEVTLYWSPFDDSTTVEIRDSGSEETVVFSVQPKRALEAFNHPFAHCGLPAGRRVFPREGDGSALVQRGGGLRQSRHEQRAR